MFWGLGFRVKGLGLGRVLSDLLPRSSAQRNGIIAPVGVPCAGATQGAGMHLGLSYHGRVISSSIPVVSTYAP